MNMSKLCFIFILTVTGLDAQLQALRVGCPDVPVQSLERSVSFYRTVLSFKVVRTDDASDARTARLALGDECLDITQYETPGRPYFADSRANDRWFQHIAIEVADMPAAYSRLREAHVALVAGSPQTLPDWNVPAAGISALYFRDPDGHYLELIHFPPGKGQQKWQAASGGIFRGIDHTAIAVADMQRSLEFYQNQLHFHKTGGSENYGFEQEHLSGVFNAHVLITSLRAESGIGIELLEYLTPATGRPIPPDMRPEDLACWKTPIEVDAAADKPGTRWAHLPPNPDGWTAASWIEDPDGHRIELVKR
jgi:catechol 2,3-dioxygenase-like lactoylglutathione lyase family enzyme